MEENKNINHQFADFECPKIEECILADDYLFFEDETGMPIYPDIHNHWKIFSDWVSKIREEHKKEPASAQVVIGTELLKWAENWDVFALYMIMRVHWKAFRDAFILPDAPKEFWELVDYIMYEKMTEGEMWRDEPANNYKLYLYPSMEEVKIE